MEREIKFRGIQTYGKKLVYGYLVKFGFENRIYYGSKENEFAVVDGSTVGQYTGLKDKNGKEIYEGDILLWDTDTTVKVVFKNGEYLGVQIEGPVPGNLHCYHFYNSEVIGNIHENQP